MKKQLQIDELKRKFKNEILEREMKALVFGGNGEDDQRRKDKNQFII